MAGRPFSETEIKRVRQLHAAGLNGREISNRLKELKIYRSTASIDSWLNRNPADVLPVEVAEVIETKPKILVFDIETADFNADFGEVFMMGYRWWHEDDYHIMHSWDYPGWDKLDIEKRDYFLIEKISKMICDADVLVGHYSIKFDFLFLQTRCLIHKLPPLPVVPHVDTWRIARYQLKFGGNGMKNIAKGLDLDEKKASLPKRIWRRAHAYDMDALGQISDYCLQDVKTQYEMAKRLFPLAKAIPNANLFTDDVLYQCPSCGSKAVKPNGHYYTKVNRYQRYQCKGCGRWSRGRRTQISSTIERQMY